MLNKSFLIFAILLFFIFLKYWLNHRKKCNLYSVQIFHFESALVNIECCYKDFFFKSIPLIYLNQFQLGLPTRYALLVSNFWEQNFAVDFWHSYSINMLPYTRYLFFSFLNNHHKSKNFKNVTCYILFFIWCT